MMGRTHDYHCRNCHAWVNGFEVEDGETCGCGRWDGFYDLNHEGCEGGCPDGSEMNTKASEAQKRADRATRSRLLRKALEYAWTDFAQDVREALAGPGEKSMAMEWRVEWIGELSAAVGPISWEEVEIPLLRSGWFQRVHEELGYEVPHALIGEWLESHPPTIEAGADS